MMVIDPKKLSRTQKISVASWMVLLASTVGVAVIPTDIWVTRGLLLAMFLSELAAGPLTNHVTLSPIMQYIDDRSPQDGRWWSILFGYRGMVLWYSVFLVGLLVWASWGVVPWYVQAAGGAILFAMTGPHWLWPERYGW